MIAPLHERLGQEILLLDGGLGSELIARGLPPGQAPERWVVEAGAAVVGGCCGTDPRFIRAARAALDARQR